MNGEEPRIKVIRTVQDSSSEPTSQSLAPPRREAELSKPDQNTTPATPRTKIRLSIVNKGNTASSPLEIPETQLEPPSTSRAPPFAVIVPPAPSDKSDYETLRSSQINSDGGIEFSSSLTSQLLKSQPKLIQSATRPRAISISSLLTSRQKVIPKAANKDLPSSLEPSSSSSGLVDGHSPLVTAANSAISSQRAQPEINQPVLSSSSNKVGTPRYVPSTERASTRGPENSIQLRSELGPHRVLTIADLICPETNKQALDSRPTSHQVDSQASIPPNTFPPPQPQIPQPSQAGTESAVQPSHQANSVQYLPASQHSSPWAFNTQLPVKETTANQPQHPTLSRGLLEPFEPANSSGNQDPSPSRQARSATPASNSLSASPPLSLRERLRQNRENIARRYSHRYSISRVSRDSSHREGHSTEMDLSGASNVTSPVAAGSRERLRESLNEPNSSGSQAATYDIAIGGSALPIQNSIEHEQLVNDDEASDSSKGTSSQQSLENERDIAQVNGMVLPSVPLLGPDEYTLGLPAEGKIQSVYFDIIKAKRKAILKFINRHEAIGSANTSPSRTNERNDMNELIQRLHDTTTHIDLGLPGIPTQYSINSEEHAAYANYAGSKFSLLGHLVDLLKGVDCSIVIAAQSGPIQDLLEQYLSTKDINVKRHDRVTASQSQEVGRQHEFQVELMSTMSSDPVNLSRTPILMLAFDASFDAQDHEIKKIRLMDAGKTSRLVPVVHLLVTNSSEHVNLCIPRSLPSPVRLKLLVRTMYQARSNLGGKPTYVPNASDEPQGRAMDFSDLQKALRKSPERKLALLASFITQRAFSNDFDTKWGPGAVSELQLSDVDDTSPKASGTTTVAETPKEPLPRSRTPASRADTPSGKKRLLEVDSPVVALHKRQRLTPTPLPEAEMSNAHPAPPMSVGEVNKKLRTELTQEKDARQKAEGEKDHIQKQSDQWRSAHAALLRRYEIRKTKCHELENNTTKLLKTIENNKSRQERTSDENTALKEKLKSLQQELNTIRETIKSGSGDAAATEIAREEARNLLAKNLNLEKSLENTRKDFEFTREQYQNASSKAAEFAAQVRDLEEKVTDLTKQASDEKRRLKELNHQASLNHHLSKISELEQEKRTRDVLLKRLEEENRQLKRNRGVQTRGSSVQPPGSPGIDTPSGGRGPRSRQGSPAPGLLPHHGNTVASRGSLLRHER